MIDNPFLLRGYVSEEYFCDRSKETADLIEEIRNGNNVTLIAPRRIGKTGLIQHLFAQPEIKENYYTFLVDIYATKTVEEFIQALGKSIINSLRPRGAAIVRRFIDCIHSLRSSINFDINGNPSWGVEIGEITSPKVTLDEIFSYLSTAGRHCIVAIDEFQTVASYKDGGMEALLRTCIQHCHNASFIFSGSQRKMMSAMFLSHSRPFYQSTSIKGLGPIDKEVYADFAMKLMAGKPVSRDVVHDVYDRFEGITWYVQRTLNKIYSMNSPETGSMLLETALCRIIDESSFAYQFLLYQLPSKQKELLYAISREGKARNVMSAAFVRKYKLSSSSSVQSALRGLLEKDFITEDNGTYEVYDKFFAMWLNNERK